MLSAIVFMSLGARVLKMDSKEELVTAGGTGVFTEMGRWREKKVDTLTSASMSVSDGL